MSTTYSLGGISKLPTTRDKLQGYTEVFFYNPTHSTCRARVTAYFEQREPVPIDEPIVIGSQKSDVLVMPDWKPDLFQDVGFWALKLETDTVLDCVVIQIPCQYSQMAQEPTFKGGVSHLLGTGLHTQWHYADGLWLNWTAYFKGDISRAPFPFNELEYYYFLNPGEQDARVDMTIQYRNIEHCTFHLNVPAGRVYAWCNYEKIPYNQPYGVKVVSSQPISTTSARYIYALGGFEEWGINLHCGMPAATGPITA